MKIKELPFFNRPGYKLQKNGVSSLDTAELLAIIFGKGSKKESALELSNRLLANYNLHRLDNLGFNELKNACNGDSVKVMKLFSLIELSKRYNKLINKGHKVAINSAKDVYDLLVDEFGSKKKEYFICLYLDTKNRVIRQEVVSVGTLNASLIHPREIFKTAIQESANAVILVHNHPSGDCEPSSEDEMITEKLTEAGEVLGIKVLDHVVIGADGFKSFKE